MCESERRDQRGDLRVGAEVDTTHYEIRCKRFALDSRYLNWPRTVHRKILDRVIQNEFDTTVLKLALKPNSQLRRICVVQ